MKNQKLDRYLYICLVLLLAACSGGRNSSRQVASPPLEAPAQAPGSGARQGNAADALPPAGAQPQLPEPTAGQGNLPSSDGGRIIDQLPPGAAGAPSNLAAAASGQPPSSDTMTALNQKFATAQLPAGSDTLNITVTDDEVNQAIQAAQAASAQAGQSSPIQNPVVLFTGGNIVLTAAIVDIGQLTAVFIPYVVNGTVQFDLVSASVGGINVPPPLLQEAENTLNSTLGSAMNHLPAGLTLQNIIMGEGTMTVIVGRA